VGPSSRFALWRVGQLTATGNSTISAEHEVARFVNATKYDIAAVEALEVSMIGTWSTPASAASIASSPGFEAVAHFYDTRAPGS